MGKVEISENFLKLEKVSTKLSNYLGVYEFFFSKYYEKNVSILEIGIRNGGSLELWNKCFPRAEVIGVDINSSAKSFEADGYTIIIGDQSKQDFWNKLILSGKKFDIIIDDGAHTNSAQLMTLYNSINLINDGGFLVIEDVHGNFESRLGNPHLFSFVNFSKKIIDLLCSRNNKKENLFNRINSIHYYQSLVIFEIGNHVENFTVVSGRNSLSSMCEFPEKNENKAKSFILRLIPEELKQILRKKLKWLANFENFKFFFNHFEK